jgi:hypothetical protein
METLLGEELLDRWIGYIDHEVVEEFPAGIVEADNLLKSVRRVVDEITASLADKPWIGRSQEAEWAAFRLEPQENNADYPKRKDQLTQISAIPDLHQCVFSSNGFDSVRFSKCGETFAYVKIDGADGLPEWGFKDRAEIEEALIAALETSQLGTVVGGGNGRRYCYIDLSLLDVNKAVSVIRETLARGGVSIRSWLLFFDSDYSAEWIGVFPDSPPPPMEDTGGKE